MSSSATARPADDTDSNECVQDFIVKYKRPFKATELSDFNLVAKQEYNVTSAFGCYLKTDTEQGTNPDALFKDGVGC